MGFASGSPFPDFHGFGKTYKPGQGNNAYIFPGASLAVIAAGIHHISDGVFLSSAEALADMVTEEDLAVGRLYPPLSNIQEISVQIAKRVAEEAYEQNTASTYPSPRTRRLSFGLTSTITTMIRFPTYPAFMHGRRRCKR